MKHRQIIWTTLLFPLLLSAYDLSDSLRINGFGTLGIVTNDSNKVLFASGPNGALVGQNEFNWAASSLIGLQARYQLLDNFSLTAQGRSNYERDDRWRAELDWGYLQYESPQDISIRIGKLLLPNFHASELQYVGYARTYARPEIPFFGVGGFDHLKGVQLNYNTIAGNYDLGFRVTYGMNDQKLPQGPGGGYSSVKSDEIKIANVRVGDHTFFINFGYTHINSDHTRHLLSGETIDLGIITTTMWSTEWEFRYGGLILNGGFGNGLSEMISDEQIFYSALSYPIDAFTPYVLFGSKKFSGTEDGNRPPPQQTSPANIRDDSSPLPGQLHPSPPPNRTDKTWSVGVRYDVHHNTALKFQWDHINTPLPLGVPGGQGGVHNTYTLTLDWMF